MITTTNSTESGTQTETYKVLLCSPLLDSWVTITVSFSSEVNIFLSITGSISWEFSNPCCPQQGIFPSFTVQTLVSLSDNNRFVGWSYYSASRCCLLDVLVSRTLESLSIRKGWNLHIKKCIMWSFFDGVMTISVDRLLVPLLGLEPVPLLLEDQRGEASSEADNKKRTLLSIESDLSLSWSHQWVMIGVSS